MSTKPTEPIISTLANIKQSKSITNSSSSNGNGNGNANANVNTMNASIEYVSPIKKASDHSISQLISYPSLNHSSYTSKLLPQTQPSLSQTTYTDNPTTSTHSVSNKSQPSSSIKQKTTDNHHRPQSNTSNGSNNNNFLHNNNNSKQSTSRSKDTNPPVIDLCDTDEGETTAKKPKLHKHKHNKKSKESVGSNVPLQNTVQSMLNQIHQASTMTLNSSACDEVDHNQIIHDLKVNRSFLRKYFDLQL